MTAALFIAWSGLRESIAAHLGPAVNAHMHAAAGVVALAVVDGLLAAVLGGSFIGYGPTAGSISRVVGTQDTLAATVDVSAVGHVATTIPWGLRLEVDNTLTANLDCGVEYLTFTG